jgi:hypothetical protein
MDAALQNSLTGALRPLLDQFRGLGLCIARTADELSVEPSQNGFVRVIGPDSKSMLIAFAMGELHPERHAGFLDDAQKVLQQACKESVPGCWTTGHISREQAAAMNAAGGVFTK